MSEGEPLVPLDAEAGVSDATGANAPSPPPGQPPTDLGREIRRLRRRMTILTVLVCVVLVVAAVPAALLTYQYATDYLDQQDSMSEPTVDQSQPIEALITATYGDALDNVQVQSLKAVDETPYYAFAYRLSGSPVPVAGIASDSTDLSSVGYLPTADALTERLTLAQMRALLAEWSRHTDKPAGFFRLYNDPQDSSADSVAQAVVIGGRSYPGISVWRVTEGYEAKPGEVLDPASFPSAKALVFYLDPKTGRFTYLGDEAAQSSVFDLVETGN